MDQLTILFIAVIVFAVVIFILFSFIQKGEKHKHA
ncbi:MAG: hypothetical protein FD145_925 [Candidatus Saganbacteria bacterium]|uniref:Uncharacterized protein n=1 Tax=Candidatus Saganbacteria bacterium TaxID=2575572 RepID=A0A833L3H6_UNCSA|nr:MAG: hypothetical protein FD145_925 [Candidatus Saganbacteria bacterium]